MILVRGMRSRTMDGLQTILNSHIFHLPNESSDNNRDTATDYQDGSTDA